MASGETMPADRSQAAPAEDFAFHGQAASLVVREAQSSGLLHRSENPILLQQVINDRLLLSIDPTGEQQNEEGERRRQRIHSASLPERLPGFKDLIP
jgi:hypothetical protein